MKLFERARRAFLGPRSEQPGRSAPSAAFMRGGSGPVFTQWRPAKREVREDVRVAYSDAAARTLDLIQNSGFISGIVDQAVTHVVGTGLRLHARPEYETLAMTKEEAADWGRSVEARFALWAETPLDCDAGARHSFGAMQASAFRSWLHCGEIAASLPTFVRQGGTGFTKVLVMPGTRISVESETLRNLNSGVFLDRFGAAIGYRLDQPNDKSGGVDKIDVPARDSHGRVAFLHVFDGMPGQVRGISPFTPVLSVARRFDQLNDATLTSAIVRAVFAATIEGEQPTDEIMNALLTREERGSGASMLEGYLAATQGWVDNVDINLGVNGRIAHIFPGQKLNFHESKAAGPDYEKFANFLLREIARCAGLTYESATGDYTNASYASINNGMTDLFGITLYRRKNIVTPFCQAAYEAWLDEQVFTGAISFPGGYDAFLANRPAACRAFWRGAARPKADEIKTAKAHEIWARIGVMTDEMIAAELGVDIEDVYEQRAREQSMRKEYGLRDPFETETPADQLADSLASGA